MELYTIKITTNTTQEFLQEFILDTQNKICKPLVNDLSNLLLKCVKDNVMENIELEWRDTPTGKEFNINFEIDNISHGYGYFDIFSFFDYLDEVIYTIEKIVYGVVGI